MWVLHHMRKYAVRLALARSLGCRVLARLTWAQPSILWKRGAGLRSSE